MFKFDGWPPLANHWWQAAFYLNLPFEIILILRNDSFGLIVAAFTICITVVVAVEILEKAADRWLP